MERLLSGSGLSTHPPFSHSHAIASPVFVDLDRWLSILSVQVISVIWQTSDSNAFLANFVILAGTSADKPHSIGRI